MAAPMLLARRNRRIRREILFRDIDNPLDYLDDDAIIRRYRLSRPIIHDLCEQFQNELQRPTMRSHALPVSLQVMVALRFYATGSFQAVVGDVHNISRPSVFKVVKDMTQCLVNVANIHIRMPITSNELAKNMNDFSLIANMPNTIGCIDETHIRIKSPSVDEHLYINRKNYHSINVQGVCDANLKFINIVAKWPDGTHDAFIWSNSALNHLFETGRIAEGWLLGDSGYPLRPWLLTPVNNPSTNYNTSHIRTRNFVERSFGVLKSHFRCLDTSGGSLLHSPRKACEITVACAVLHNMCISRRIPLPDPDPRDTGRIRGNDYAGTVNDGTRIRSRLITGRFSMCMINQL
ncbi:putative nuclease HARBI1 [Saccostrea cucullata]|uniref:putative nuclease HARBI1 n=1 Tax=Saccostrea cuccullata TaxID=36930 RepID=UPI002ED1FB46